MSTNIIVSAYIEQVTPQGEKMILMQFLKKVPPAGAWAFPGGKVEMGEDLKESLKREVKEELGVEISIEELIAVGEFSWTVGREWVNLLYRCVITEGIFENKEQEKISQVEYRTLSDIPNMFRFLK